MNPPAKKPARDFIPAKPAPWLLWLVQNMVSRQLNLHNRVHIPDEDLARLKNLPPGTGVVLTPNHADEIDARVCIEVSRLSKRQLMLMCNREAFDEWNGVAGWGLQRIGAFSIERGGHDAAAKNFAIDVVKNGKDVLTIFPEGEIFYLNDSVQPFHSGAVELAMQGIIAARETNPNFTACLLPMAIKYRYAQPVKAILEDRVRKLEQHLERDMSGDEIRNRLASIVSALLQKAEIAHNIQADAERHADLSARVAYVRGAIFSDVAKKYTGAYREGARTIDRAFQLSAHVREILANDPDPSKQKQYHEDLVALGEVAHLVSWQPEYFEGDSSQERVAEVIKKMERELYGVKRPKQLAKRNVFLRIGQPIDLGPLLSEYLQHPRSVTQRISEQLRSTIQIYINELASSQQRLDGKGRA